MSYVIRAILNDPDCGSIAVSFPIPVDQYDQTIEKLWKLELGASIDRDCTVDEVESRYRVLDALKGTLVNVDHLEGFYDYRRYGEKCVQQEGGQFNACGYVAYHGTMTLEELMMEDPAEQSQREQGIQMGGLSG